MEYLVANGADVSAKDGKGQTPLEWAEMFGHQQVVKFLRRDAGGEDRPRVDADDHGPSSRRTGIPPPANVSG